MINLDNLILFYNLQYFKLMMFEDISIVDYDCYEKYGKFVSVI